MPYCLFWSRLLLVGLLCAAHSGFAADRQALTPLITSLASKSIKNVAESKPSRASLTALTTDFSVPEPHEKYPGGSTTHTKRLDRKAFSHPSANMSFERKMDFAVGDGFFRRDWVTAPASTDASDGLGPLYNARACQNCHLKDGRGHPPKDDQDLAVSMFLRLSIPPQTPEHVAQLAARRVAVIPDPMYGTQLQNFSIAGLKSEGRMKITYTEKLIALRDNDVVRLQRPHYAVVDLQYGPLHPDVQLSPRVAPPMIGLGLLEAIREEDILARADPDDADHDGISGKPNWVWSLETGRVQLGRFGWKAGAASINEQSQGAFAGDMGLSTPLHPSGAGECTVRQTACQQAKTGNSARFQQLETGQLITELTVFYSRNLAVPARRAVDHSEVLRGKKLFYESGCVACHTPKYVTRKDSLAVEQSSELIWPYTDLLLHDMGEGLADHRPEGEATGREWRTPPLWGLGLTSVVNGHSRYLHDGRARSTLEAILWHGGEAKKSQQAVVNMSRVERVALIRFVESL